MKRYLLLLAFAAATSFWFVDAGTGLLFLFPLLMVTLVSAWPAGRSESWRRPDYKFDAFLLLWALYLFASMSWSAWPQVSFWLAIVVACIPLVCLAGSRYFQLPSAWPFIRGVMQATAALFAGWLVIEFFLSGGRSDGPLLDPNAGGALVNLFLLPTLWVAWAPATRRREQWGRLALIALLAAALFSTGSRGALLALVVVSVMSLAVLLVFRLPFKRQGLLATAVAFSVGFAVIQLAPQPPAAERSMTTLMDDSSANARLLIWRSTWDMYLENPVFGAGLGSFPALYPQHRSPLEGGSTGNFAHNDYLQFLAEGGVPLLAMLLVFGLATLRWGGALLAIARRRPERLEYYEAIGLAAGIAGMFAHATVNFIFYVAPLALWIGIYAGRLRALATAVDSRSQEQLFAPQPQVYRPARVLLGAAGGMMAVWLATDVLSHQWLSRERVGPDDYQVGSPRFQTALAITHINPFSVQARDYLVRAQTQMAFDNRDDAFVGGFMAKAALGDIDEIVEARYATCAPRVLQAMLLDAFPVFAHTSSPEEVFVQILHERPDCLEAALPLARIYRDRSDPEGALRVLEAANQWLQLGTLDVEWRIKVLEETASAYLEVGRPEQALVISLLVLNNDPESTRARETRTEAERRLQAQSE